MIRGQLLKFADRRWTTGTEATQVADGTTLVAVGTVAAWVRWEDGKPVEQLVRRPGERLPERDQLSHTNEREWPNGPGNEPQDPWQNTRLVYLLRSPISQPKHSRSQQVDEPRALPGVLRLIAWSVRPLALVGVAELVALGKPLAGPADELLDRLAVFPRTHAATVPTATSVVPSATWVASVPVVQRRSANLRSWPRIMRSAASAAASSHPVAGGNVVLLDNAVMISFMIYAPVSLSFWFRLFAREPTRGSARQSSSAHAEGRVQFGLGRVKVRRGLLAQAAIDACACNQFAQKNSIRLKLTRPPLDGAVDATRVNV